MYNCDFSIILNQIKYSNYNISFAYDRFNSQQIVEIVSEYLFFLDSVEFMM